jgi:hypothetical protein
MAGLRAGEACHHQARRDKSKEANGQSHPIATPDEVEAGHNKPGSRQQAAEKPERGLVRGEDLSNCPPKAAEEYRTQ